MGRLLAEDERRRHYSIRGETGKEKNPIGSGQHRTHILIHFALTTPSRYIFSEYSLRSIETEKREKLPVKPLHFTLSATMLALFFNYRRKATGRSSC